MNLRSRITVAFVLAVVPFTLALAAPGNVTGIKGDVKDGKAHVSWQKPAGEVPASYHIFFSRQSILQQNGAYDDFETAPAGATDYTFQSLPYTTPTLYVSVLAVNAQGDESPLFQEEARIDLGGSAPATSSAAASSASSSQAATTSSQAAQNPASGVLAMLSTKTLSATGVIVTFSSDVGVDPTHASQAFTIVDASGAQLRITRLVILGNEVTLNTVTQERGRVYRITATDAVTGKDGSHLDAQRSPLLFVGDPSGAPYGSMHQQVSSQSSSQSSMVIGPSMPSAHDDVRSLQVRGQVMGTTYQIQASWLAPATSGIKNYIVTQSLDRGHTFSTPQSLQPSANGIKINGVPGGDFGVMVQVVYLDGITSRGTFQTINLPKSANALPGTVGSMGKGNGSHLPQTGMEAFLPMMLSGVAVSAQIWRRNRRAKMVA